MLGTIFIIISTIILAKDKSGIETVEELIEEKNLGELNTEIK